MAVQMREIMELLPAVAAWRHERRRFAILSADREIYRAYVRVTTSHACGKSVHFAATQCAVGKKDIITEILVAGFSNEHDACFRVAYFIECSR